MSIRLASTPESINAERTETFFECLINGFNLNDCSERKGFRLIGKVHDAPPVELGAETALLHEGQLVMAWPGSSQ